ncbi:bifunctional UDP-N-acetylglucosamine diphosphorylase/glucosamine-1-phosphate N-acetyltransferase GlmU [Litorivivens sp.]|uniref:bifunctional UDP-N-acetylglucosamine diphosphorylase/glucosamine-1-phosphate N-acetyltransferase GlmU n=1 Tax=Litorivivens sp. TaxID=2020868 RepID=UPI003569E1D8
MKTEVVILAAGKGTRMRSGLPKVMHPIAGKPMLGHVVDAARAINAANIHVVVGHGADQVTDAFADSGLSWVEQLEQKGTGHAVAQALPKLVESSRVLILYGDVPLIAPDTLARLLDLCGDTSMALLTTDLNDPTGYGRIVREFDKVVAIVEQKDASRDQLAIQEVNTGIMAVSARHLNSWLPKLSSDNAQGEYYLTDIIAMAVADGVSIEVAQPATSWEVQGVNNRMQLNELERYYQQCRAKELMASGATLADAARIDIRGSLTVGEDCYIDVNCVFEGQCEIGANVHIGPNCVLTNSTVASGSTIKANSVLEDAVLGEGCDVGPFARLRPGTVLASNAKIGNFVETKKAVVGQGSKVNHLSYIGDSELGDNVNVGAGTITCNYDGVNKSKTVIGDGAFIGSNTSLVAPVSVGKNATVGAGSTITSDVPDEDLAVARGKQRNISGWKRPTKK